MKFLLVITFLSGLVLAPPANAQNVLRVTSCEVPLTMKITSSNPNINASQIKKEDLKILSNGVEGTIVDLYPNMNPYNIVMLLDLTDRSEDRINIMKKAVTGFIKAARKTRNEKGQARINNVAIVAFGTDWVRTLTLLTTNPDELALAYDMLSFGGNYMEVNSSKTCDGLNEKGLNDALTEISRTPRKIGQSGAGGPLSALQTVNSYVLSTRPSQENAIVIVSNAATFANVAEEDIVKAAQQTSALIYTIELTPDEKPTASDKKMKTLAEISGGAFYTTTIKNLMDGVKSSFVKISDELANRHFARYVPPHGCDDDNVYSLKVEARGHSDIAIHTRLSYVASSKLQSGPGHNMLSEKISHEGPPDIGDVTPKATFIAKDFVMQGAASLDAACISTAITFEDCKLDKPALKAANEINFHSGNKLEVAHVWSSSEAFEADLVKKAKDEKNDLHFRLICQFPGHGGTPVMLSELQGRLKNYFEIDLGMKN